MSVSKCVCMYASVFVCVRAHARALNGVEGILNILQGATDLSLVESIRDCTVEHLRPFDILIFIHSSTNI